MPYGAAYDRGLDTIRREAEQASAAIDYRGCEDRVVRAIPTRAELEAMPMEEILALALNP